MSKKSSAKIDKFYFVFFAVLAVLTVILIVTFRSIFSAFSLAFDVSSKDLGQETKINSAALTKTYDWAVHKQVVQLQMRD